MKKTKMILSILLLLSMLLPIGCTQADDEGQTLESTTRISAEKDESTTQLSTETDETTESSEQTEDDENDTDTEIEVKFYYMDHWGIDYKLITGEDAANLANALTALPETGETAPAIPLKADADPSCSWEGLAEWDVADPDALSMGDMWIETNGKIYRFTDVCKKVCRVEEHLGDGVYLDIPEELTKKVRDYWFYYPYDYYQIKFEGDTREDRHIYSAYSPVKIEIEDFVRDPKGEENKLTFSMTADTDMTVSIFWQIAQSDDVLWDEYYVQYNLKAGEKTTLTRTFSAWADEGYFINMRTNNTFIQILAWQHRS